MSVSSQEGGGERRTPTATGVERERGGAAAKGDQPGEGGGRLVGDGVRVGHQREQGPLLRLLAGFQRVHEPLPPALRLRPPPRGLPRVPPPLQGGERSYPQSVRLPLLPSFRSIRRLPIRTLAPDPRHLSSLAAWLLGFDCLD